MQLAFSWPTATLPGEAAANISSGLQEFQSLWGGSLCCALAKDRSSEADISHWLGFL